MYWPFSSKKQKINNRTTLWIALLALGAMGVSLWIGMQQSVWFDESYSILVAQQKIPEIVHLASVDTHPPAYYILLRLWANVFGWEELALRTLSALAFGGSVFIMGLLVKRQFGTRAALAATALAVVTPLLVRYGFEIRMYSVASLIGIAATYVMVKARESSKNNVWLWVAYAVLVTLGMLTLYYLALLWIAHVAWLLYMDRARLKKVWQLPWVYAYAAAALMFAPWLPAFLGQVNNGALASIGQPMNLEQLLGVLSFNTLYKPVWQLNVIDTVAVLMFLAMLTSAYMVAWRKKNYRSSLLLLTAYIAVPIIVLMVVSLARPMYVERYLSHVAIGLTALIGVLLAFLTERGSRVKRSAVYVGVAAVMVAGLANLVGAGNFNFQRMQKPAIASAVQPIDCVGASVVAADPYVATELSYYLPKTCDIHFYSQWKTLGGGYAPFSESPLMIQTMEVPQLASRLYYAHYDTPKLTIPANYQQVASNTNGGLTVTEYEAR